MDFDDSPCSHFGRCGCLNAVFRGLNGSSVMMSVVLRSGHLDISSILTIQFPLIKDACHSVLLEDNNKK